MSYMSVVSKDVGSIGPSKCPLVCTWESEQGSAERSMAPIFTAVSVQPAKENNFGERQKFNMKTTTLVRDKSLTCPQDSQLDCSALRLLSGKPAKASTRITIKTEPLTFETPRKPEPFRLRQPNTGTSRKFQYFPFAHVCQPVFESSGCKTRHEYDSQTSTHNLIKTGEKKIKGKNPDRVGEMCAKTE